MVHVTLKLLWNIQFDVKWHFGFEIIKILPYMGDINGLIVWRFIYRNPCHDTD